MKKTLQKAYYEAVALLNQSKIDNANQEAVMFLEMIGISKVQLLTYPDQMLDKDAYDLYMKCVQRRMKKEPLQYIIGKQSFMGLDFKVNSNVLIPRQDTETLVETVISHYKQSQVESLLDLCTGSGCIAISLGFYTAIKQIVAVDISKDALQIAEENAKINHIDHIQFVQSNLFENIEGSFDMIVSNPPYIPTQDIEELMEDVKNYEPKLALDGLEDGLYFYRTIAKESLDYLNGNGYLFFEIGYNQGQEVKNILKEKGYEELNILKDLAGLDRVVYGRKSR
jgi:release factor glutamine methyltransferase